MGNLHNNQGTKLHGAPTTKIQQAKQHNENKQLE
jgi:hypothetical protein